MSAWMRHCLAPITALPRFMTMTSMRGETGPDTRSGTELARGPRQDRLAWRVLRGGTIALVLMSTVVFAQDGGDRSVEVRRLSDRVLVLVSNGPSRNTMTAIAGSRGIAVVDTTTSPQLAARLRGIIEREFGRDDFIYAINTHHHWDHVYGNQTFADATIVSHERTPGRLRQSIPENGHPAAWLETSPVTPRLADLEGLDPSSPRALQLQSEIDWFRSTHADLADGFERTLPSLTFNDRLTLDLGDLTLRLYYYGQADSDNSIVVHVPEERVLVTGDLYWFGGAFTDFGDGPDLEIPRWIETLDAVLADDGVDWVVCGHLEVWPGETLELRRRYIGDLWAAVTCAKADGLSLEETKATVDLEGYAYIEGLDFDAAQARLLPPEYRTSLEEQHRDNVEAFFLAAPADARCVDTEGS